jgi:hypothetical protein
MIAVKNLPPRPPGIGMGFRSVSDVNVVSLDVGFHKKVTFSMSAS